MVATKVKCEKCGTMGSLDVVSRWKFENMRVVGSIITVLVQCTNCKAAMLVPIPTNIDAFMEESESRS
jgi:hypothetical protein